MLPAGLQVTLVASGEIAMPGAPVDGYRRTGVAADGTFAFADVSPGQYTVLARSAIADEILWASADIDLEGDDVSGLALTLMPGMTVAGQVRFDGTTAAPDASNVRVTLEPVPDAGAATQTPGTEKADASGRFTLAGVTPGRYRLVASIPSDRRWELRSAVVDGSDTLDVPFTVRPNQNVTSATVTLTDRMAEISGALRPARAETTSQYTVILFPADPALWAPRSRRIRSDRASSDGQFAFRGLPAGDYCIAAAPSSDLDDVSDPALLRRLVPACARIAIADAEHRTLNLTVDAR
jgi:hypothetical protein